jgi:hypothetical protein
MTQERKNLIAIAVIVFLALVIIANTKRPSQLPNYPKPNLPEQQNPVPPPVNPEPPSQPKPKPKVEPQWTDLQPVRPVTGLGTVLSDIDSHMPAGHQYKDSDKITWAHETTHGLASRIRQLFQKGGNNWVEGQPYAVNTNNLSQAELKELAYERPKGKWLTVDGKKINGFYVLHNRAVVIDEPNTTVSKAASLVPKSLRGQVYNLYMVQQARSWTEALYVFDEWTAYTNGSDCRLDLKISSRAESVQYMMEFNVYALCVAQSCQSTDPQFKNFLMWQLERTMEIYRQSITLGDVSGAGKVLTNLRSSADAEELRQFTRSYCGQEWTNQILGF